MIRKYLILTLAVLLVMAGAAAIASAQDVPGVTEDTILLGTSGPMTGPANAVGTVIRSMETYFNAINAESGINGRQIELIILDDAYDPAKAQANVRKLIEDEQVFAVVGVLGASIVESVIDYIDASDVPWVGLISGSRKPSTPPRDNVFVGSPEHYWEAHVLYNYAVDEGEFENIGIFYQNDEYGAEGLAGAGDAAALKEMELAAEVPYEMFDTDFSTHALKMMQSEADAVLLYGNARFVSAFVKACEALGYSPQYFGSTPISGAELFDLVGAAWDGALVTTYTPDPFGDDDAAVWYRDAIEKYAENDSDRIVSTSTMKGFYYADFVVEGLMRAEEPLTRESFIAAMNSMDGVDGRFAHGITYNDNRRNGPSSFYILRADYENKTFERVTDWLTPED